MSTNHASKVWRDNSRFGILRPNAYSIPCIFVGTMDGKLDQSSVEIKAAEEEAPSSE